MGVEGEPMRVVEKTKRRQRRVKRVRSKMRFTILRVRELRVLPEGAKGDELIGVKEDGEGIEALIRE